MPEVVGVVVGCLASISCLVSIELERIALALNIFAVGGVVTAFTVGLRQYKRGQDWEKAKVLISTIDTFESDNRIRLVRSMLDYDECEIDFIDEGVVLHFTFRNKLLLGALRVTSPEELSVLPEEQKLICDAFDVFFDFFQRLNVFQKRGILSYADYAYFYYWFDSLANIGKYKKSPEIQAAIVGYLKEYHSYSSVEELLNLHLKEHPENQIRS